MWDESTPRFITTLSLVIEKLVARGDQVAHAMKRKSMFTSRGKSLNVFHGMRPPSISITKYLERLYKYTGCSPSCFVVCYVYIDRLLHKHASFLVLSLNVHRLLVTSVMIASKMLDDVHHNNAFFARVGGISNSDLNRLELEFLFLLDFGVAVTDPVFQTYSSHLEREMILNDAVSRMEGLLLPPECSEAAVEEAHSSLPPEALPSILDGSSH